jgi:FKBP-type peptidyl-prolyl cis-trans isomerase
MAEPAKSNDVGFDKSKLKHYLIPAGAVAAVVVLVGLVISVSGAASRKMSDGSDGTASDSGLKEIAPGVRYRDIKEGSGEACPPGAEVTIHYTAWLENGAVFDSTKEDKYPSPTKLKLKHTGLLPFWAEGVPGMKPGGIRKLVVSPEKAYGERGNGSGTVSSGATLIFEVELIEFAPSAPSKLSDGADPNAADTGLKDIGGGLLIRDLKEGSGDPVKAGATVTIHYTGWLQNGDAFDSSRPHGKPTTFDLNRLIKGWQKGIPGMKPGGIRKLVVPPELGYGSGGQGDIPPGATLVFEVELIQ